MLRIFATLGNVGFLGLFAILTFKHGWPRYDELVLAGLLIATPTLNLLALWHASPGRSRLYKESLLGLWIEARKKKLRKELTEQD